jgi:hypothetical protein
MNKFRWLHPRLALALTICCLIPVVLHETAFASCPTATPQDYLGYWVWISAYGYTNPADAGTRHNDYEFRDSKARIWQDGHATWGEVAYHFDSDGALVTEGMPWGSTWVFRDCDKRILESTSKPLLGTNVYERAPLPEPH